jgi:glycosyltransferase involved in cell wall biosynthesis
VTGGTNILSSFRLGSDDRSLLQPPGPSDPLIPGVTVVMCTYKRAGSMKGFLGSLAVQALVPRRLIIVDASPDEETERLVRGWSTGKPLARLLLYFRVSGPLKGLTRQRNFGIRWADTDLIAFFDDDVVLKPDCLSEMEIVHRRLNGDVVGVGGYTEGSFQPPDLLWRTRRLLGIVSDLRPGSYQRSGMSVPWSFMPPTEGVVDADWLPGCAMMWKTGLIREIGFSEAFEGYAQGEDLDFSLRARRKGKLVIAGAARFLHLFDENGRPNHKKLGYMAVYNRYQIQRRGLDNRSWLDVAWFVYAWGLDTLMLGRNFIFPRRVIPTLQQVGGRLKASMDLLRGEGPR